MHGMAGAFVLLISGWNASFGIDGPGWTTASTNGTATGSPTDTVEVGGGGSEEVLGLGTSPLCHSTLVLCCPLDFNPSRARQEGGLVMYAIDTVGSKCYGRVWRLVAWVTLVASTAIHLTPVA